LTTFVFQDFERAEMNIRQKQIFRIIIGAIIIGGSIYISVRYLFKSPPFITVLVLIALISIIYLTVDYIVKKGKKDRYGN
jgi:cell division protein FtsW (lipid II flippase)